MEDHPTHKTDKPVSITPAAQPLLAPESAVPATGGGSGTTDQHLVRFVVTTSTIVASLIALLVIMLTAFMPFFGEEAPDELINWGGIIIGFYFGTFASLMKDWMTAPSKKETAS